MIRRANSEFICTGRAEIGGVEALSKERGVFVGW